MPIAFRTRCLEKSQIERALPLVKLVFGDQDAAAWFQFVTAQYDNTAGGPDPCGVIAVEDTRQYILGLFCFRVIRTTPYGPLLDCDHFVVPDMVRSGLPFVHLTRAAETLARKYDCDRVRLAVPGLESLRSQSANRFRTALHDNGYNVDCLRFEKKIEVEAGRSSRDFQA